MHNDILSLTEKFIKIPSVPSDKKALSTILDLALSQLTDHHIDHFQKNGVRSALIYNTPHRPKKFTVLLNGHLDIIPAKEHQYTPVRKRDRLYGAGAMDMKANVACLISAFKAVAHTAPYPLGLQLVTDEEIGGFNGTKHQIESGVRSRFVIAGEPTNFDIVHQAKGVLQLYITARGTTSHGAYPWRGDNASVKMMTFLTRLLESYPTPKEEKWATTVTVSSITTPNNTFNKIPDECHAQVDIRYVPQDAHTILADIKKHLPKNCSIEIYAHETALATDPDNTDLQALTRSSEKVLRHKTVLRGAHGTSDARHYARVACPGVEFGPIGGDIGGDKEWVSISSLATYCRVLEDFLLSIKK